MKRLFLGFICCCLPLLALAKEHAYGIGNWIRGEHLEVGKSIVIDYGYALKINMDEIDPDERRDGYVMYVGIHPMEDQETVFVIRKTSESSAELVPAPGGTLIEWIYVRADKEREFADKLCRPLVEARTSFDGTRKTVNDKDVERQMASNSSKRIDVVLAKVGQRWVAVYQ
ncbi:MAG: hypothetical protein Q7Q73_16965 [Verrucomicrobiota bacterium JB024]|nr:hypothetical protein [Verrucomicrobiota bacterium JB024]